MRAVTKRNTAWMAEIQNSCAQRKTMVITLMDDEMKETASWQLEKAWPTKYAALNFNSGLVWYPGSKRRIHPKQQGTTVFRCL